MIVRPFKCSQAQRADNVRATGCRWRPNFFGKERGGGGGKKIFGADCVLGFLPPIDFKLELFSGSKNLHPLSSMSCDHSLCHTGQTVVLYCYFFYLFIHCPDFFFFMMALVALVPFPPVHHNDNSLYWQMQAEENKEGGFSLFYSVEMRGLLCRPGVLFGVL